ncbi:MAG: FAD-dependent monooxygenase [Pseudonocardiaceae bacterium]
MRILISGASVAGPVLAYWLTRHGFTPTVVEKAPTLRKTGGHAVDLFGPALDVAARMGLGEQIQANKTGVDQLTLLREGNTRPVQVELARVFTAVADHHLEIMRDDLSEIFYDATRDDVEYVFGDSITSVTPHGDVTFEHGEPRTFDLVIGADGLHSNVRRLVFGAESEFSTFLGAYVAVASVPNYLQLDNELILHAGVGRTAGIYRARHMDDAQAVFLFRNATPLNYHHHDIPRQKQLLREAYTGAGWEVPRLLAELDQTPAFYFDSITQLQMRTWSRGRVSLVGDAGYCPGPAVGGSTSLAVVGAYVLAGALAQANGDPVSGFRAYEQEMGDYVRGSRSFACGTAKRLIPNSRPGLWALANGVRLVLHLPLGVTSALTRLNGKAVRPHDSITLRDYSRCEHTATGSKPSPPPGSH